MHLGQKVCPGRQNRIWQSEHSSGLTTVKGLGSVRSLKAKYSAPVVTMGGLGVEEFGVYARSGVPTGTGLVDSGLFLCFDACLLVDHGRSLRAFCITKERALRRPWRELFADLDASTNRKSCWTGTAGGVALCFPLAASL